MTFHTRKYIFLLYINFFHTRKFLIRRTVLLRTFLFRTSDTENFQNRHASYYAWNFSVPDFFWNTEGFPKNFFSAIWDKSFAKTVMPPPINDIFDTRRFLKHRRVAVRSFLFLWEKKIRRKIVIFPYYAWAFPTSQIFLTHWRVSHKMSWQSGTEYFRRKTLILSLLSINFSPYQKISDRRKGSLTKFFVSAVWDGKFSTKPWCPPSYDWNFFKPEIFWNTKGFPRKIVGTIGQKLLNRKQWYPLLMHQSFWCPNFFEAPKCPLAMFFWHCETKNQQNRAALSSYAWNVSIKGFFGTQKCYATIFFGTESRIKFDKTVMLSPPMYKISTPGFFWNTDRFS